MNSKEGTQVLIHNEKLCLTISDVRKRRTKDMLHTSVYMPKARETAAATIRMMSVKSLKASQTKA